MVSDAEDQLEAAQQELRRLRGRLAQLGSGRARAVVGGRRALLAVSRVSRQAAEAILSLGLGRRHAAELRAIFDEEYYLRRYPDVARAGVGALAHYLTVGGQEGRDPSPFFASRFYLLQYPDVAESGVNPLIHYVRSGAAEDRAPSSVFDPHYYRATYADAADASVNPLVHYLTIGVPEGRFVSGEHRHRVFSETRGQQRTLSPESRRIVNKVCYAEPRSTPQSLPLRALEYVDVDLITVDLWDTLLSRWRPADAPKLATSRRLYLRHASRSPVPEPWRLYGLRVAIEAELASSRDDQEYHLVEVLEQTVARTIPGLTGQDVSDEASYLAETEWAEEVATTYSIDEMRVVLERLRQAARAPRIAVLSDFYVGADDVNWLLRHHSWFPDAVPVLVSCEQGASKRLDGRLFEKARRHFGTPAERHLHIGDNRRSDFDMQLSGGGQAALLQLSPPAYPEAGELQPTSTSKCYDVLRYRLAELARFQVEFMPGDDGDRRARAAGVMTSPLAVGLVTRAIEVALERGVDRVHYLSREGAFLHQVHMRIADEVTRGIAPPPTPIHLEISRRASFAASLEAADPRGLSRMWSMYGSQSLEAMLVSLGQEPGTLAGAANRHGLDLETPIPGIARDPRVRDFLLDDEVAGILNAALEEARTLLIDYLRERTSMDEDEWILVDVGWRGSIQDNLAHIFPSAHFHGVYLGLFPFLNAQPPNCTKEAVGFNAGSGDEYRFAEPPAAVERPWTPHAPSTVGYARLPDGHVVAVHDQEARASDLIVPFQDGVMAGADTVASFLSTFGFTVSMVLGEIKRDVRAYYEEPFGGAADIWFNSQHDDTFGALNVTPFGKDPPQASWITPLGAARLASASAASRWEPGFSEWLPVAALRELRRMIEESIS